MKFLVDYFDFNSDQDAMKYSNEQYLYKAMGNQNFSSQLLKPFPKDHWEQLKSNTTKDIPISQGTSKIYRNILTNEEVQQYSLLFQTNQHYQNYLSSFCQRLNQDHIVSTRYIDLQRHYSLCGCGKYASIYTQRIPLRLNSISSVDEPEGLYILRSMLSGFVKLFELYGYFQICKEMVGIDREGRVKVWININFSKNQYFYSSEFKKEEIRKSPQSFQDKMISDITNLLPKIQTNSAHPSILQQLQNLKGTLTFTLAKKIIASYTLTHNIQTKNYFESILPLIHQTPSSSDDYKQSFSNYDIDDNSFNPIQKKHRVIYYMKSMQQSEGEESGSEGLISARGKENERVVREDRLKSKPSLVSTTKSVMSQPNNLPQIKSISVISEAIFSQDRLKGDFTKIKPKIQFNYNHEENQVSMIPNYFIQNYNPCHTKQLTPDVFNYTPSDRSSLGKSKNSKRSHTIYNGLIEEFVIDKELMEDSMSSVEPRYDFL